MVFDENYCIRQFGYSCCEKVVQQNHTRQCRKVFGVMGVHGP